MVNKRLQVLALQLDMTFFTLEGLMSGKVLIVDYDRDTMIIVKLAQQRMNEAEAIYGAMAEIYLSDECEAQNDEEDSLMDKYFQALQGHQAEFTRFIHS